jgi:hypothetical protein
MLALRLLALLSVVALSCMACDPERSTNPEDNRRGVRRVEPATPPVAPVEPPPREFRVPRGKSSSRSGAFGTGSAQTPQAAAPDGGLPTSDGGTLVDDSALAAAVEAQGRTFARCFPPTTPTLPDVAIDFQISVTGIVTRTEVRGDGLDETVTECLTSTASTIRFPSQTSGRAYRYPMRLRRTPNRDGGPAPTGTDGGRP